MGGAERGSATPEITVAELKRRVELGSGCVSDDTTCSKKLLKR